MLETTRRRFYLSFIYGLGSVMGAALAVPALAYLFLPPKLRKKEEWVEAGSLDQITPELPIEVIFHQNRTDGWKVTTEKRIAWVVELPDQNIVAYGPQCTHLGCAYHWEQNIHQFVCPCHNSFFSIDGKVLSGPAPRPLDRYKTKIENQKLLLGQLEQQA